MLTWVINFIKWHSGCTKFNVNKREEGQLRVNEDGSINNDDQSHQFPGKSSASQVGEKPTEGSHKSIEKKSAPTEKTQQK